MKLLYTFLAVIAVGVVSILIVLENHNYLRVPPIEIVSKPQTDRYIPDQPQDVAPVTSTTQKSEKKQVRVLCWVMTMLKNLKLKTKYVKKTWGKRCDVLLFFGSQEDKEFPVIGLDVPEGRSHLTEKTYESFRYIYKHYMDQADWFMKADDDTFVVVDNLKDFLSGLDTEDAIYMGFRFTGHTPQGYHGGGAGYVLSKEALRRFATKGDDPSICPFKGGIEDVDMGRCMHHLGVKFQNTLDEKNRTRFHSYDPVTHMYSTNKFITHRSAYGYRTGAQNISEYPITFHYVKGVQMEVMELLLYHTKHVSEEGTVLK